MQYSCGYYYPSSLTDARICRRLYTTSGALSTSVRTWLVELHPKLFPSSEVIWLDTALHTLKELSPSVSRMPAYACPTAERLSSSPSTMGSTCASRSWRDCASLPWSPIKLCTLHPETKIMIGDHVGLNGTSVTARSKTITVEDQVMIAPNCTIMDSDFHQHWPPEKRNEHDIARD